MQNAISPARREESLYGALVGCAIGDALEIAYENLSPRRTLRLFPDPTRYHLLPSVGLISDDAEQAMMTLRALACSGGEPARFQARLATELRVWLATLPAGIGLSTARAGVRLWLGFSPQPVRRPSYPLRLGRNLLFLGLVIAHLVRRALPPY